MEKKAGDLQLWQTGVLSGCLGAVGVSGHELPRDGGMEWESRLFSSRIARRRVQPVTRVPSHCAFVMLHLYNLLIFAGAR